MHTVRLGGQSNKETTSILFCNCRVHMKSATSKSQTITILQRALSVLMLCAPKHRQPFSYHTKMAVFEYFHVLFVFSSKNLTQTQKSALNMASSDSQIDKPHMQPISESHTGRLETQPISESHTGRLETQPISESHTGRLETQPISESHTGRLETQPISESHTGGLETQPI